MNKYITNIDFSKYEIYLSLADYISAIRRLLSSEYFYYIAGKISIEKIQQFIEKVDPLYQLSETSLDKTRRYKLDQPTVEIRCFNYKGSPEVFYIIMARYGCNGSNKHLFFEREKFKDSRKKEQRISISHYEFLRVNKEKYEYIAMNNDGQHVTIQSDSKQSVWTLQLTEKYKSDLKEDFRVALLKRNKKQAKAIVEIITKLIGWHKVRHDYKSLLSYFNKNVVRMRLSDPKYPIKQLSDLVKIPTELRYFRPQKAVEKSDITKIIKEYKVAILKQKKPNKVKFTMLISKDLCDELQAAIASVPATIEIDFDDYAKKMIKEIKDGVEDYEKRRGYLSATTENK